MPHFGLLNLHKPSGLTSRQVVNQVQRLVRPAKIGHAGTLDPLASGVLVIGIGQATRLVEYVQQMPKRYRGTFLLGRSSPTEDTDGPVTVHADAVPPSRAALEQAAAALTGPIQQRPPAYSALKVAGQRAYDLARAGKDVELAARTIHIYRLELVSYAYPELVLDVECGSGTYVRSLGRDLAEHAGTSAVMSALVRTAIGPFTLEQAISADVLTRENLGEHLLPPRLALTGLMGEVSVSSEDEARLANGREIQVSQPPGDTCAAVAADGQLIAILSRRQGETFRPEKFFPRG